VDIIQSGSLRPLIHRDTLVAYSCCEEDFAWMRSMLPALSRTYKWRLFYILLQTVSLTREFGRRKH
jgi:hypothetical protein